MDDKLGAWVRSLRADGRSRDFASSEQTRRDFAEWLGPSALDWAAATAREVAAATLAARPGFAAAVGEQPTVLKGIEGGVLCVLASVHSGVVQDPAATPEVPETAREFVELGVPLTEVWATVRQAHRRLVDRLTTACRDLVPVSEQAAELQHMFRLAFECVDDLVEGLGAAYAVESDRWQATAGAVREELVNAVLADTVKDFDTVSQQLRYELRHRHHVGIVVWHEDTARLQNTALRWLEAGGAQQTLLIPRGQSLLYAWGNRRSPFPVMPTDFGGDVRVAAGAPSYDVPGFRGSHNEACDAHRVVRAMPGLTDTVVPFAAVSLLAALSEDGSRLRRFVSDELGELAADDANTRELRRTLRVYLETRNAKATAAQLVVARNTVTYRLQRAEQLRGRGPDERLLELWVALVLAEAMGSA
ncbi:PucR family transcriptional regulator [Kutzneria sp. NPDC052558]|uniref:PucR family transcriptional regulator n=1 Tax=Kutzneria sp. NPDC052558 TaxID=3364121 RepID=UPI0037CC318E